ncbi:MAG TPA: hypothetical protein VK920_02240 [Solirubrobacterales bacterium]|nr:hypothetical protein [Solirubrobacterales bacterium]
MEGFLPIFFLGVVLKIPIGAALFLIWYAVRAEPEAEELPDEGEQGFKRWRPQPRRPRGPRRGPHPAGARAMPDCPPGGRFRVAPPPATARATTARSAKRRVTEPAQR